MPMKVKAVAKTCLKTTLFTVSTIFEATFHSVGWVAAFNCNIFLRLSRYADPELLAKRERLLAKYLTFYHRGYNEVKEVPRTDID